MSTMHIKVDDNVYVLSGKDAGKTGKVLRVDPVKGRVIVQGVNIVTKHQKPNPQLGTGGLVKVEGSIDASNVMLVCPHCKRPSKTGKLVKDNGEKVRVCKACGKEIDVLRQAKK